MNILFYLSIIFIGFASGRLGHVYFGFLDTFHHWILGLILIILGLIFRKRSFGLLLLCFGTGFFISDFNDFLGLKLWGADENTEFKFWGID